MLQKRGKIMVGWDEILGPDLPKEVVIQSWRGKKGLADAVQAGPPGAALERLLPRPELQRRQPLRRRPAAGRHAPHARRAEAGAGRRGRHVGRICRFRHRGLAHLAPGRRRGRAAVVAPGRHPGRGRHVPPPEPWFRRSWKRWACATAAPRSCCCSSWPAASNVAPLRTLAEVLEPVKEYKRHFQGYQLHHPNAPEPPGGRRPGRVGSGPALRRAGRQRGGRPGHVAPPGMPASRAAAGRAAGAAHAAGRPTTCCCNRCWPLNPSLREYAPLSAQLAAVARRAAGAPHAAANRPNALAGVAGSCPRHARCGAGPGRAGRAGHGEGRPQAGGHVGALRLATHPKLRTAVAAPGPAAGAGAFSAAHARSTSLFSTTSATPTGCGSTAPGACRRGCSRPGRAASPPRLS